MLEDELSQLGVPDDWDLLMVGDGSGSNWKFGAGWGVACIERNPSRIKVCFGAMDPATVNIAELMPYIQGLGWYIEELRRRKAPVDVRTVRIITDSQHTQQKGGSDNKAMSKKNRAFWAVFTALEHQGLVIHWHHFKRDILRLNSFTDRISKLSRIALKDAKIVETAEEEFGPTSEVSPLS